MVLLVRPVVVIRGPGRDRCVTLVEMLVLPLLLVMMTMTIILAREVMS
jgi:hypothetical protein